MHGLGNESALYVRHYAAHGLFERLRADHERYPDTMDHRYGPWRNSSHSSALSMTAANIRN
jgi:hypothetical protein